MRPGASPPTRRTTRHKPSMRATSAATRRSQASRLAPLPPTTRLQTTKRFVRATSVGHHLPACSISTSTTSSSARFPASSTKTSPTPTSRQTRHSSTRPPARTSSASCNRPPSRALAAHELYTRVGAGATPASCFLLHVPMRSSLRLAAVDCTLASFDIPLGVGLRGRRAPARPFSLTAARRSFRDTPRHLKRCINRIKRRNGAARCPKWAHRAFGRLAAGWRPCKMMNKRFWGI